MRRSADHFFHAIKDGIRNVRYTIRAEAVVPGTTLPKAVGNIDLAPFIKAGSTVGQPALRALDGLLTQVESIATEVIKPRDDRAVTYPASITAFFDESAAFSSLFYDVYKRLLQAKGVGNVLLSEYAFDDAQTRFRARHGDMRRSDPQASRACAGLACALAEARPIRKIDLHDVAAAAGQPFMLAPNIYCAAVVGLTTALITRDASLRNDLPALEESVDSVVNARFDRFKRAMSGKSPALDLATQFEAVLPFLP